MLSFQQSKSIEDILKEKMDIQSECWNNGDMECFMQTYWKSDSLSFIGAKGITYGWNNTLERYKVGYPTEKERGRLVFSIISIEALSEEYSYMVGKWRLSRDIEDAQGHFTLLWKKIEGDWFIVSDHSSGE